MTGTKFTKEQLKLWRREDDARYKAELDAIDPDRIGIRIHCPGCHAESWIKLPAERYGPPPLSISCPTACGTFGPLGTFAPRPEHKEVAGHFDIHYTCRGDGTVALSNGAIFRCPSCAIENPRHIMSELREGVLASAASSTGTTEELADLLSRIIATFDGVMRACNKIAISNREILSVQDGFWKGSPPIPPVHSFQNIAAARTKLLPEWDIAKSVSDWNRFILLFQKRHLFAHTLGVADQDYLSKSGDTETPIGKKVSLTKDDVIFLASETEKVVRSYFGNFLS